MDNPIFKIESVVQERNEETLQDFEGPLDLILSLLAKNKIEIQNIPIALILDQYLDYLEQRQRLDLEIASEFITMAAHLMYIKSRMLLPNGKEETQGDMYELIRSLQEQERLQKDVSSRQADDRDHERNERIRTQFDDARTGAGGARRDLPIRP
jgi:segregation and condensation protein A